MIAFVKYIIKILTVRLQLHEDMYLNVGIQVTSKSKSNY